MHFTCTITEVVEVPITSRTVAHHVRTDAHREPQRHVAYNPSRGPLKVGDQLREDPSAPGLLERVGDFTHTAQVDHKPADKAHAEAHRALCAMESAYISLAASLREAGAPSGQCAAVDRLAGFASEARRLIGAV